MGNNNLNNIVKVDFSICTINGNLNVNGPFNVLKGLISIFQCDDRGHLLMIQTADDVFSQKLHTVSGELKAADPRSYGLIIFLEKIKINEKFLLTSGNINADRSFNNYVNIQKIVYEINNIQYPIDVGKVGNIYNVYCWGDKKAFIGEGNRQKRVCRFCNEKLPTVTFKDHAHAISESLGNKLLFCNEECDNCNHKRFSEIEQEFINAHLILYSLFRKKGKQGILNVSGENINIDNKNTSGSIEIKHETDLDTLKNIESHNFKIKEPSLKYSPQNLYKCLCKFAVSIIDKEHLKRLSETIRWLGSDCTKSKLPTIWVRLCEMHDQPLIGIFVKKETADSTLPEFVIILNILNIQYLYVLPFVDDNEVILAESARCKLKDVFDLSTYTEVDFSSDKKMPMTVLINIEIPEGAEFISINKSEFDILSDKELEKKYPNISGYFINNNA